MQTAIIEQTGYMLYMYTCPSNLSSDIVIRNKNINSGKVSNSELHLQYS